MRSLALALLLACGCAAPPTQEQVVARQRAGEWVDIDGGLERKIDYEMRVACYRLDSNPSYTLACTPIPPVTPEANDAQR